jgi:hypothetical protein
MDEIQADPIMLPKPLRRGMVVGILAFVAIFMVAPAVLLIWLAFCAEQAVPLRIGSLVLAALLLALPVRGVWMASARKLRTGRWGTSPEDRLRWREKYASRGTPRWFKPAMTGLSVVYAGAGLALLTFAKHPDNLTRSMGVLFIAIAALDIWSSYRKRKSKSASEVRS